MISKKNDNKISKAVIARLPRYFRYLRMLLNEDKLRISSSELAEMMNVTASQIRQDLNCFGDFGHQGYGYNVPYLYRQISALLGVDAGYKAIIIGAGKLGQALATSPVFTKRGVEVVALFDNDTNKVGHTINKKNILNVDDLEDFCAENKVDIAVLTLPAQFTEKILNRVLDCKIPGIWNCTSYDIPQENHPDIKVVNVHMGDSLMRLCYYLQNEDE